MIVELIFCPSLIHLGAVLQECTTCMPYKLYGARHVQKRGPLGKNEPHTPQPHAAFTVLSYAFSLETESLSTRRIRVKALARQVGPGAQASVEDLHTPQKCRTAPSAGVVILLHMTVAQHLLNTLHRPATVHAPQMVRRQPLIITVRSPA